MEFVKGDTIELEITANVDITGWKIRAEFYDNDGESVQLATTDAGGETGQITIDNVSSGIFTITCEEGLTTNFNNDSFLEIEREDSTGKKATILQSSITMKDEKITWNTPS